MKLLPLWSSTCPVTFSRSMAYPAVEERTNTSGPSTKEWINKVVSSQTGVSLSGEKEGDTDTHHNMDGL